jgi:hypothetical protein
MMQGYERSKIKVGNQPAVEEEREIVLPTEYRMGAPGRRPVMIRAFDPDRSGSMGSYMAYKKGGLHKAADQVRNAGRHDDTMLIHVNPDEFQQMRQMFGDPIINPETGLPEYGFFKSLKKALKKIAPVLSIASLFVPIPGLNTLVSGALSKLAPTLMKAGSLANTLTSGAISGGITGGKKGAVAGGLGAFASTTGAAQDLGGMVPGLGEASPAVQTAVGRGLAGATGAAITGQDPLTAALTAAGTGYAADQFAGSNFVQQQKSPLLQQAMLGAAQGINVAGQTGGDLGRGALIGGTLGAATSAADSALARYRGVGGTSPATEQPSPLQLQTAPTGAPVAQGMSPAAQPVAPVQLATAVAPAISNLMSRPEAAAVIAQVSAVPTKAEAIQAAAPLASNPDTRPVYDAMSNFKMCDSAPHFGACFAQNWGSFMQSISANSPKMPMKAATGGLAQCAGGGCVGARELAVGGPGDGQDDQIPALLSDGEFIIPADVVSALGSGSTDAGSKALYDMIHNIRRSYRKAGVKDIPTKAKSPLAYMRTR